MKRDRNETVILTAKQLKKTKRRLEHALEKEGVKSINEISSERTRGYVAPTKPPKQVTLRDIQVTTAPHRRLLAIHAAIARVMRMSGAGEYIDKT